MIPCGPIKNILGRKISKADEHVRIQRTLTHFRSACENTTRFPITYPINYRYSFPSHHDVLFGRERCGETRLHEKRQEQNRNSYRRIKTVCSSKTCQITVQKSRAETLRNSSGVGVCVCGVIVYKMKTGSEY